MVFFEMAPWKLWGYNGQNAIEVTIPTDISNVRNKAEHCYLVFSISACSCHRVCCRWQWTFPTTKVYILGKQLLKLISWILFLFFPSIEADRMIHLISLKCFSSCVKNKSNAALEGTNRCEEIDNLWLKTWPWTSVKSFQHRMKLKIIKNVIGKVKTWQYRA